MKHAFLIMAHHNYNQLRCLIGLLDHYRVDIYLHIDKKSPKFDPPICKYSSLIQIPSIRTNWGGYSLVECELRLLEEALKMGHYRYMHLLSGQDLPLKPIDDILSFFDLHSDYNFILYNDPDDTQLASRNLERVKYYYPFQDIKPRRRSILSVSQRVIVEIEKILGVDRTKNYNGQFKAGSQWWSIKPEVAEYIISKRDIIKELFRFTMCDEMFVQTLIYNSDFYETVYNKNGSLQSNQRLIAFKKGAYTWTIKDIEEIKGCGLLFARKFDERIDSEVIHEIIKMCRNDVE